MKSYLLDNPAGPDGRFNLGDDIQVLAAQRFMTDSSELIDKNKLNISSDQPGKIIMNGWFMHDAENWPPAPQLEPLLTSFHMNPIPALSMLEKGYDFSSNMDQSDVVIIEHLNFLKKLSCQPIFPAVLR
jgi:hypothetical protein